jgi:hypothetical protein
MSSGRFLMRGRVFQGRAFAGRALADSGVTPQALTFGGGVVAEFRGRTAVIGCRGRVSVLGYRPRTITMERAR